MTQQGAPEKTVFDVAKVIAEELKQLPDRRQQEQAIRYASDSLGLGAALQTGMSGGLSVQAGTHTPAPSSGTPPRSTDIKTFSEAKLPKSDQQFAAVVAYYYQFEAPEGERKDTIDAATLTNAARLVGRKKPPKPSITLANAKNAGYLDSAERGQFKINTVGENLVAVTLPGGGSEAAGGTRGGPGKRRNKQAAKKKSGLNKQVKGSR